jgi:hypothetical protein
VENADAFNEGFQIKIYGAGRHPNCRSSPVDDRAGRRADHPLVSHDKQTAVVRFYTLGGQYSSDWGEIMAAAILIVAPVLVFFLLMQRRFIEGMASGSVKG